MRIERAVFYNGRYEGVYSLVMEDKLEWHYVGGTYTTSDKEENQRVINLHTRLDLPPERFQKGWEREGRHYSIIGIINFKPEDLCE